ncbi:MAG: FliM/FliN family flagellar motor switch protein [Planctomycetia bacterium]|nr:FliM/FliN family flagellar motor switch protein [Planctomycetia bacterium]
MNVPAENEPISRIRPLNLRRRMRFSGERLGRFGELFLSACHRWETQLSPLLRTPVEATPERVEQTFWKNVSLGGAYARNLSAAGLPSVGVVFQNGALFPMLDRMLGAGDVGTLRATDSGVLTRLEEKLADRIFSQIYTGAIYPWRTDDGQKTLELCSSSEFPFTPREALVRVPFTVSFAAVSGTVELLFSASVAESLLEDYMRKHPEARVISSVPEVLRSVPLPEGEAVVSGRGMADALGGAYVDVSVQMSGRKVTPQSVGNWRVGEILSLEKSDDTPFDVLVEGVSQFHAAAGKYKTRKVFRIV